METINLNKLIQLKEVKMYVTRFDPFKVFKELEESNNNISSFAPSINSREDENGYYIEVDLPGVKKEDVTIDLDGRVLNISGERKFKTEEKEKDYYKTESYFGKFQRSFTLPESVDLESIKATSNDGVLEIVVPKSQKESVKKITIE